MQFVQTDLPGVIVVEPDVFEDARGFFYETYHARKYAAGGIREPFVQDNLSRSVQGTVRGLHYQIKNAQGKLVTVIEGSAFDVTVDIRRGSPTFGKWFGIELSAANKRQVYIPTGFAHGFCVISGPAILHYKCTDFYSPADERGVIWNDQSIKIDWPISNPVLSPKDQGYKSLVEMDTAGELPVYGQ